MKTTSRVEFQQVTKWAAQSISVSAQQLVALKKQKTKKDQRDGNTALNMPMFSLSNSTSWKQGLCWFMFYSWMLTYPRRWIQASSVECTWFKMSTPFPDSCQNHSNSVTVFSLTTSSSLCTMRTQKRASTYVCTRAHTHTHALVRTRTHTLSLSLFTLSLLQASANFCRSI